MKHSAWEYRIQQSPAEAELNALGHLGWEAVSATDGVQHVLLKRPALSFREQVTLDQRRRYFGYWGLDVPGDSTP